MIVAGKVNLDFSRQPRICEHLLKVRAFRDRHCRAIAESSNERATDAAESTVFPRPEMANMRAARRRYLAGPGMNSPRFQVDKVRRTLRKLLLDGHATEGVLAERYSTSTRSLHRMLTTDGTNFKKLLDDVRFEVARQLLTGTDMSAAELAVALGYSDASAFNRAFRRWTGSPPGAWRESARTHSDATVPRSSLRAR